MTDRERFVAAIEKDPYDLHTRKVYADWLDEFGTDADADEAVVQREWTAEKQDAIVYLTEFAAQVEQESYNPFSYRDLITAMEDGGIHFKHISTPDCCYRVDRDRLWECYELATGRNLGDDKPWLSFSCSC